MSIHTEIAHQKIGIEKLTNKKLKWEPPNWEDQYAMIREMRSDRTAPVDTMGCDAISNSDPILTEKVRMSIWQDLFSIAFFEEKCLVFIGRSDS